MPERRRPAAASPDALVLAGRAVVRLGRKIEVALADAELTLSQYRVLVFLANGESRPSRIAPNVDVTRPTVTALVDGLVARGFVDRQPDESDRRRVRHRVTPAGKRALADADRAVQAAMAALAAHLPEARAAGTVEALGRWHDALDAVLAASVGAEPAAAAPTPGAPASPATTAAGARREVAR